MFYKTHYGSLPSLRWWLAWTVIGRLISQTVLQLHSLQVKATQVLLFSCNGFCKYNYVIVNV